MLTQSEYESFKSTSGPFFGYELLRDLALNELLGQEHEDISYWLGKELARKIPLATLSDVQQFFVDADWGNLVLTQEKKNTCSFELSGTLATSRLKHNKEASFLLEAGFLSESIQQIQQAIAETTVENMPSKQKIVLTVQIDTKDTLPVKTITERINLTKQTEISS